MNAPSSSPTQDPVAKQRTVLVVDDHDHAREVISKMLEEGGYAVVTAANGNEAIAKLASGADSISAVLTDVSMPDMTGVELAYYVRQHYPTMPVTIVSGDVSDLERSLIGREGVPFIKKPVRIEALHTAIREAIEKR